jgi:hypothetical protein
MKKQECEECGNKETVRLYQGNLCRQCLIPRLSRARMLINNYRDLLTRAGEKK